MTDNEIIEALGELELYDVFQPKIKILIHNAIYLINRQKAEIERLEKIRAKQADIIGEERGQKYELLNKIGKSKSEAIKEFAERLKIKVECGELYDTTDDYIMTVEHIDNLVKVMED